MACARSLSVRFVTQQWTTVESRKVVTKYKLFSRAKTELVCARGAYLFHCSHFLRQNGRETAVVLCAPGPKCLQDIPFPPLFARSPVLIAPAVSWPRTTNNRLHGWKWKWSSTKNVSCVNHTVCTETLRPKQCLSCRRGPPLLWNQKDLTDCRRLLCAR